MKTIVLLFTVFLVNIIQAQNFEWAKQIGSTGNDAANSVATDAAGNVYTVGGFGGTVDFDPGPGVANLTSAGSGDIFISKLSASGNLLWVKQIGGAGSDAANSVFIDQSGNIYVTGSFNQNVDFDPGPGISNLQAAPHSLIPGTGPPPPPTNYTFSDIYILKLNASGNFVWVKQIGGSGIDYGTKILVDSDGNVFTVGFFSDFTSRVFNSGSVDFDPGPGVFNLSPLGGFILKLNSSGDFVWATQFGKQNYLFVLYNATTGWGVILEKRASVTINSLVLDQAGNIYTTGYFSLNNNDFDPGPGTFLLNGFNAEDMFIAKYNSSGDFQWVKQNAGAGINDDGAVIGSDIAVDASGNVYTTGYFAGKVDFDPGSGETIFETMVTGGYSEWMKPNHDVDIFVSKLNASGNLVWVKQMGGISDDRALSLALDGNNNIYTTGYFSAKADFDPGLYKFKLNANGNGSNDSSDVFISKLDASGNFVWAGQLGGSGNDRGNAIAVDNAHNILTTGLFSGVCDFDPGSAGFNLISTGFNDIFIHKLSQPSSITQRNVSGNELSTEASKYGIGLYPNPTQGLVTIASKQNLSNASMRLFNSSGQLIMEKKNISGSAYSFDISNQVSGVYYAEIMNEGKKEGFKLVKY